MAQCVIRGKKLSYLDVGEGAPVLFGHSYLWDCRMWEQQVKVLSKNHRCIVPDLWAHGLSDTPPAMQCSLDELAEDHWQLMQQLGIEQFSLVGLSIGGMWAMRLALKHPETIDKLVLMGTDGGAEPDATRKQYLTMLAAIISAGRVPPPIIDKVASGFFSPSTIKTHPELYTAFCNDIASIPAHRIPGIAVVGRSFIERKSILDQLPGIDVPTLIIVGSNDAYRPQRESEQLAAAITGSRLEIINDAGHISTVEQDETINPLLADFLA